jgi:hypothetical protein
MCDFNIPLSSIDHPDKKKMNKWISELNAP